MDECGHRGCNRPRGHGTPGNPDPRISHRYPKGGPGGRPAVEMGPPVQQPSGSPAPKTARIPSTPPDMSSVMTSHEMHRKGKRYAPGTKVVIWGVLTAYTFLEEMWDIDNPGWEWVKVQDSKGHQRIFPMSKLK